MDSSDSSIPFFWIQSMQDWPLRGKPVSLTMGNFDGVHKGHKELLKKSINWAQKNNGYSVVLTFHPHPVQVLAPEKKHVRLFDLEDQKEQFMKMGVTGVYQQPFSRDFSEMNSEQFLNQFLWKTFQPGHVVVGYDFSFGRVREGNYKKLVEFAEPIKIETEQIKALQLNGITVSTTAIRYALQEGNVRLATDCLGRPYYFRGIVEKGEQRGRLLDAPTANIRPTTEFVPKMGVYATRALWKGKTYFSVTNIGKNLTFIEGDYHPIKVETHLLDFSDNLYGEELKVELVEFIRSEKKFASLDELKAQIKKDIQECRRIFAG